MNRFPLLLEPSQLAASLPPDGKVLIIEQAARDNYLQNHIPGSVWLDFKRLQLGTAPTPGALPSMAQLSAVFSELGLTPDTHVICSDDEGGGWAGRLIWVLDCLGAHPVFLSERWPGRLARRWPAHQQRRNSADCIGLSG